MSNEELLEIYKKFDDYLRLSSWGSDFLRSFGFGLVQAMANMVDALSNVLYETIHFLGFYNDAAFSGESSNLLMADTSPNSLFSNLAPFQLFGASIAVLSVVAILFLGKSEETREVPRNVLSIVIIIALLPSIMSNGVKIITSTSETLTVEQGSLGLATIKENTIDMYAFIENEWATTSPNPKNKIDDLVGMDINETISDNDSDPTEVLNHRAVYKAYSSDKSVVELDEKSSAPVIGGMINLFLSRYYRWHVSWLTIILTLLALLCSLVLSILRCGRLGMEVATNYLLANVIAFFSFTNTKRLKQCVMGIITSFITILTIFVMFYVFLYYMSFVKSVTTNTWVRLFGIIGGCWLLYDGPAIIQQLFGVDAGLGTAGAMATAYGLGSLRRLKGILGNSVASVAGAGGVVAGFLENDSENKRQNTEEEKQKLTDRGEKNQESSIENEDTSQSREKDDLSKSKKQAVEERMNDSNEEEVDENDKNTDSRIPEEKEIKDTLKDQESTEQAHNEKNEHPDLPEEELNHQAKEEKNHSPLNNNDLEEDTTSPVSLDTLDKKEKNQDSVHSELDNEITTTKNETIEDIFEKNAPKNQKEINTTKDLEKPTNPIFKHLDEKLSTPKQYEEKGSMIRNSYDRVKKGHQFGQDLANYRQERREYNEKKKSKEKDKEE